MGKIIDLTGCRFGKWTVLFRTNLNNKGRTKWYCRCDCGTERIVDGASLKSGGSTGCGCGRIEHCINNLVGRVFGELEVLELTDLRDHKHCVWKCRCSCGKICYVSSYCLIRGTTISCGCIKSKTEVRIKAFLDCHQIRYIQQKKFIGCKMQRPLLFDFYLPDHNIAIEYDGEMHYQSTSIGNNLAMQIKRDKIKTKYCEENDIILLRIPYWEKDNIESILSEWLNIDCAEEAHSSSVDLSA